VQDLHWGKVPVRCVAETTRSVGEGSVQELVGVDVQASLLEAQQHSVQPLTTDYLLPREKPLSVRLMQGVCACAWDTCSLTHDTLP